MSDPIVPTTRPIATAPNTIVPPHRTPAAVARQFEAVFAGQITKILMESVEQDDAFSGGHGEEMFRGVLAEQIGNSIAAGKGLGIASAVEAQIIRLQGGSDGE
ncbi:rod-binding protein [Novosphingobium colocasiae]|nr:rod-binding protein [Novosphingobium colocasiae]